MSTSPIFPISRSEAREVIKLILNGDLDEALTLFSERFGIRKPRYKIGLPKGKSKVWACYDPKRNMICFRDRSAMRNPFIVLHELYHVLRYRGGKHRGTEWKADQFALEFIKYAVGED